MNRRYLAWLGGHSPAVYGVGFLDHLSFYQMMHCWGRGVRLDSLRLVKEVVRCCSLGYLAIS